jgi:hypothetical protein
MRISRRNVARSSAPRKPKSWQRHALADRRQVVERAHRHVDFVAHAGHVQQHQRRGFFEQQAFETSDHARIILAALHRRPSIP